MEKLQNNFLKINPNYTKFLKIKENFRNAILRTQPRTLSVAAGISRESFSENLVGFDVENGIRAGKMFTEFAMEDRKMITIRSDQPVEIFASQTYPKPSRAIHDFTFNITGKLNFE